ncbi:helix-turn-helix domain-containing protein [Nocardioides sp. SOB77]|uniref:Helix-turn-helix domain-containing protein n=1 Tax=Nocardioides oceani TaxID=3058369 RepID=A0ABT8FEW7_9ACTN|nr:TetR/AcrR family transcriptional regulator [Nocardioides oceani]MDN4173221.1 helix-turn-helix domain-containing protein [Nocardioides oceani]
MTSLRHNGSGADEPASPRDGYLDAARACILDIGWRRTTLTEVARRAGVSRMTIYRTWSDMRQLLADLMTREWTEVVVAAETEDEDAPDRTVVERLVDKLVRTVKVLRGNELFVRIVELDPELILPYLLDRRGRSQQLVLDLVEQALREAQASGDVRAGDPAAMARGLVLSAHGFVMSAHTMVDDTVTEAALEAEMRVVLTRTLQP